MNLYYLIDTKSSPSWKWRQCQTEWVQPNINQNVCDNLRRALQFRSKGIAERRESVTLREWINLRGKRLDRSPFTFLNRVRRHLRNYSCFCPVTQRGKAKVDLPLDGFFNKSLLRSKIKQNNSIRTIKRPQLHASCTWTNFLLHPMKKKKNPLSNITHPGCWLRNWLQGKRSLLPTAAESWSSAPNRTPLSLFFGYELHLLIWTHCCAVLHTLCMQLGQATSSWHACLELLPLCV